MEISSQLNAAFDHDDAGVDYEQLSSHVGNEVSSIVLRVNAIGKHKPPRCSCRNGAFKCPSTAAILGMVIMDRLKLRQSPAIARYAQDLDLAADLLAKQSQIMLASNERIKELEQTVQSLTKYIDECLLITSDMQVNLDAVKETCRPAFIADLEKAKQFLGEMD